MPFTEICIYQVKPQKTEEFEALLSEAKSLLEKQEGLLMLRLIKRGYHIDMEQIKEGLPPLKLTRIVKSVKYMLYWCKAASRIIKSGVKNNKFTGIKKTAFHRTF